MSEIKTFKLAQLKGARYNPRLISDDAMAGLAASLKRFGCVEPIVVNIRGGKNTIVGGHQRYKVLKSIHADDPNWRCPCVTVDLKKADEKLLNISLNNPHIQGQFIENLADYIDRLRGQIGEQGDYLDLQIDKLRTDVQRAATDGLIDDDDVPDAPKKAKTKRGDLYLLGKHRVLCGDSRKEADIARLMNGKKADMVFTDPPYGASITGLLDTHSAINRTKHWDMIEGDQFENEELQAFLEEAFTLFSAVAKDRAPWYVWHAMLTQGFFAAAAAAAANLILNRQIIWVKPALILAFGDYHWRHELCFYGWKKGSKPKFYGPNNENTVWEIDFDGKGRMPGDERKHPTQKPVGLAERAINNSSREGGIVLDGFLGSGSTLIGSEKLARRCYGMEIDPHYCDVIVERWEKWTGKGAQLAGSAKQGSISRVRSKKSTTAHPGRPKGAKKRAKRRKRAK